jgi:hypothetical protein
MIFISFYTGSAFTHSGNQLLACRILLGIGYEEFPTSWWFNVLANNYRRSIGAKASVGTWDTPRRNDVINGFLSLCVQIAPVLAAESSPDHLRGGKSLG